MLLFYAGSAGLFIGITYIENIFHAANNKEVNFDLAVSNYLNRMVSFTSTRFSLHSFCL